MKKFKVTQEFQVFYKLYSTYKQDKTKWVSAWEFVGELYIPELEVWTLMTYKTPANGIKIFFTNPGLIERKRVVGKSGAKYYQYRFSQNAGASLIQDPELLNFYNLIKSKKV
jgi:hypothetical protein